MTHFWVNPRSPAGLGSFLSTGLGSVPGFDKIHGFWLKSMGNPRQKVQDFAEILKTSAGMAKVDRPILPNRRPKMRVFLNPNQAQ